MDPIILRDSYPNRQNHFLFQGQGQRRKTTFKVQNTERSPCGTHKIVPDQLGSPVSIPLSTFNPCTAGRLKNFVSKWQTITSDQRILNAIRGVRIDFIEQRNQFFVPSQYNFNPLEVEIIDQKIDCFLERGIIEKTTHSTGEYISNVFICPKKDGSYRLILNLKQLNRSVEYHHFKMENLKNAITLMTPNCFMATIDLKDANYSVPVNVNHRKYLRFIWKNQLFQYTCLPNGLSSAPRLFTKILKPLYATLRSCGLH